MAKKTEQQKKPSMRELAQDQDKPNRSLRIRQAGSRASAPFKKARSVGKKEYHPIKLPDNKLGRLLSRRVRFTPKFLREAWAEIRQTTWPTRKETIRLTIAVFIFSIIFGLVVAFLDFGLDKIFKALITK